MPSLLCLDLGTSAAKAALLTLDGTTRAQASSGYPTVVTADGGAEQDLADWLRAARDAIAQLLHGTDEKPVALSITGQMQDLVLLTEGDPAPAILYSDTRAVAEAAEIGTILRREGRDSAGADWDQITGNEQDATSCAAMFRRLSRISPEVVGRARGVVFGPAGHLVHALGLGAWCDVTTASATGLLDARTRRWSDPVARAAGLSRAMLPELTRATGQVVGRTDETAADLLGLPVGLPVILAPGDAGATTLGIVGLDEGDEYAYLGTSGWLAAVVPEARRDHEDAGSDGPRDAISPDGPRDAASPDGPAPGISHHLALSGQDDSSAPSPSPSPSPSSTSSFAPPSSWSFAFPSSPPSPSRTLRISALLAAGAAAEWARGALLAGITAEEADDLLERREVEHGRGPTGLLALPSIHGERYPVREPDLRAAIIGMGPSTEAIDMYAAVLEGVAHALAHAAVESAAGVTGPVVGAALASPREPASPGEPASLGDTALPGEPAFAPRPLAVAGGGAGSDPWMRILADVMGRPVRVVEEADAALLGCALAAADALQLEHTIRPLADRDSGRTMEPDPSAVRRHARFRRSHRALYLAVAEVGALR
ncbi:FGGY family carbohydrate kinase [Brachybacterium tyrofermentans]|uniref:FGGY family carbohydrate kinase n=1 Tax=Brachybacterium tyrofermentans TaxID=47848 RepID=UPI003FD6A2E6